MTKLRVLLAGETWITVARHYKGWDHFTSTTFHDGAVSFKRVMNKAGIDVVHLPGHLVPSNFPRQQQELKDYDVVILSDIGANSLLLSPGTWLKGQRTTNRLALLHDYVSNGGGLVMVGGYYSFQGIHGRAGYKNTPVEEVLPVSILPYDDRVEHPEGVTPECGPNHELIPGLPKSLPFILGYNRTILKKGASLVYKYEDDPILAVRTFGQGRTVAWTSDIGPHWCPEGFLAREEYGLLWNGIIKWAARRD